MRAQNKKLSIAFLYHMHQPVYQLNPDGDYIMPWVRMHAVKDYLDMILWVEKFDRLKLNFNYVPALLDALLNYSNGAYDIHSRLSIKPVEQLTDEDKIFILNNFFDSNYQTMILPNEQYHKLYQIAKTTGDINAFSPEQYSDIMALFNLVWIDSSYKELNPELIRLINKKKNYTLEDRLEIIDIHRKIIQNIIPALKNFLNLNKIELITSPYYHPILPILLDYKEVRKDYPNNMLSELNTEQDAMMQTKLALDRMEEIFDKRPQGIWPSEQCISEKTLKLFAELGVKWSVSDEGILANSINFEFVHDFKGNLEDPYHLLKTYKYHHKNNDVKMIFKDSTIYNLINFEYAHHDPVATANDLYDRIKVIQSKILSSPDDEHLLTIAMDGENCWENYVNDGNDFLNTLYELITNDDSLETVLISDYLDNVKEYKSLNKIKYGANFNRNLQLWINEPIKDLAWTYLKSVRDDFYSFIKREPNHQNIEYARNEIFICEGSDWFWWYGEPNYSGRDNIFDFIFRNHLKNVYRYLDLEIPSFLDEPLIDNSPSRPSNYPTALISPHISGVDDKKADLQWEHAGCIEIPDGPVLRESKLFEKIQYGNDNEHFYLKFHLNKYIKNSNNPLKRTYQMYIYIRKSGHTQALAPIRLINKSQNVSPIAMEKFHNEIQISIRDDELRFLRIVKAIPGDMWVLENYKCMETAYGDVLELKIPFDVFEVGEGETLEFLFINANYGMTDFYIPDEMILSVTRPVHVSTNC